MRIDRAFGASHPHLLHAGVFMICDNSAASPLAENAGTPPKL
ncbi:MAG: hypothetical protein WKF30_02420 [Pyrinomonadaceae bacterium]